jgi:hypothetical protein
MIAPRNALLSVALVLTTQAYGFAQPEPLIGPGDTVEVAAANVVHEGIVLALKPDTLLLDVRDATAPLTLPLAFVTRLNVKRGQKSYALTGGLVGLFLGGAGGAVLVYAACQIAETQDECATDAVLGGLVGGAVLGGVGFAIGSAVKGARWEEVPIDQLRVGVVRQRNGRLGLAVSASIHL